MDDARDLSMPALELEITSLAGNLAAGTCRFLVLLAVFDVGGGWHGTGMRSCAQWLSWRCGLSTTTAHEQLRVARALGRLPRVRDAFAAGRLSYSKVRALSRVATVDDEADLVDVALGCTAAQLDRLCAGLVRARSDQEVLAQAAGARFAAHWQPDGSLRFSGQVSAEDGAVLLAALAAVRTGPTADHDAATAGGSATPGGVGERPITEASGCASRDDASALVELARHALSAPAPAVGADPIRLVVHTTDTVLRDIRASARPARSSAADASGAEVLTEPTTSVIEPPPESSAGVWTESPGGPEAVAVLDSGPGIPPVPLGPRTLRRLLCEAITEAAPGRATARYADRRQRRALLARDQGCAFPGCPRRRRLHAHHVQHWADGGPTTVDNLALLCERHHLLVHEADWRLVRTGRGWTAVDPHGRTHVAAPPTAGDADHVLDQIALTSPPDIAGSWAGEPLGLAYAVAVLEAAAARRRAQRQAA